MTRPAVSKTSTGIKKKKKSKSKPTPDSKLPTPDLLQVEGKRGFPGQLGLPRGGSHPFSHPSSAATHLLRDRRANRRFSVRPETPWCRSAQSIVSLFKNKNRRDSWNQAGKKKYISLVFPATGLDLLISKISTIWLLRKKREDPPGT